MYHYKTLQMFYEDYSVVVRVNSEFYTIIFCNNIFSNYAQNIKGIVSFTYTVGLFKNLFWIIGSIF
jgi:hypothetical protein